MILGTINYPIGSSAFYSFPPWIEADSDEDFVLITLSDKRCLYAERGSFIKAGEGVFVPVEESTGNYVLIVEALSGDVGETHLGAFPNGPQTYRISKQSRVQVSQVDMVPIRSSVFDMILSPENGGIDPHNQPPGLEVCACALLSSPCGEMLTTPVVVVS